MQGVALLGLEQGGELEQPSGRLRRQNLNGAFGPRPAHQVAESIQDRIISFLAAKSFDALAARDPHVLVAAQTLLEGVEQSALADARFPGYQNQLAVALEGLAQMRIQFPKVVFASHRRRRSANRGRERLLPGDPPQTGSRASARSL